MLTNSRYFADGVDFWRVLYPNGSTDGPYFREHAAKRVGENAIKLRQNWSYGPPATRVLLSEWQDQPSYRLQKLGIVANECDLTLGCSAGLCLGGHGSQLGWEDWDA
jgi:hypothetical protein